MRNRQSGVFPVIALAVITLVILGGCTRWQWRECRGVGHSALYCLFDLGR